MGVHVRAESLRKEGASQKLSAPQTRGAVDKGRRGITRPMPFTAAVFKMKEEQCIYIWVEER